MAMYSESRTKPRKPTVQGGGGAARGDALGDLFGAMAGAGNAFLVDLVKGGQAFVEEGTKLAGQGMKLLGGDAAAEPTAEQPAAVQTGSALVMGSASDTEWAFDDSFTPALVDQLDANPDMSVDEVLAHMDAQVLDSGSPDQPLHHPTLVAFGDTSANQGGDREPRKRAAFVANSDYVAISDLSTPGPEAAALEGSLTSRGYESMGVAEDQTRGDMASIYGQLVSEANPGDELFAYYAGHGAPEGLVGVREGDNGTDDIFTNAQVAGVVDRATSAGAHIRFVMDSCHSGTAVQAVRTEHMNALAEQADSLGDKLYLIAAETAADCKQKLIAHLARREGRPDVLAPKYQALEAQYAALQAQFQALQAQVPPDADTSDAAEELREQIADQAAKLEAQWAELDDRWDELDEDEAWEHWRAAHDVISLQTWLLWLPALAGAGLALGVGLPPGTIDDYRTLGTQLDFLDQLQNAALEPVDEAHR